MRINMNIPETNATNDIGGRQLISKKSSYAAIVKTHISEKACSVQLKMNNVKACQLA